MKKFLIALAVVSLGVAEVSARHHYRDRGCCGYERAAEPCCAAPVESACAAPCAEPVIPVCTTTRQVPYTAYRTEVVHVAPIREEIPVAPKLVRVPQPDLVVRHKQAPIIRPDLICRTQQPCKWVCEEQAPIVRYSCPIGTRAGSCGAPACAAPCA